MLIIKNVSKTFQDKKILRNINLSIENTEVVGLVGRNGAGKTTLLRIINREMEIDSGTIESVNEIIGYLPQHFEFQNETIQEYLKKGGLALEEEYRLDVVYIPPQEQVHLFLNILVLFRFEIRNVAEDTR